MTDPLAGLLAVARAAWAVACLLTPRQVGRLLNVDPADTRALAVLRVLGGRDLAQSVLAGTSSAPAVRAVGVWVDRVHALSLVPLAVGSRRYRRAASVDLVLAATWATAGSRGLRDGASGGGLRERVADAVLPLLPGAPAIPGRR
jgi:hypothetical protein